METLICIPTSQFQKDLITEPGLLSESESAVCLRLTQFCIESLESWETLQSRSNEGTGLPRKQVKRPLMHQAATSPCTVKQVRYSPTVGHLENKKGLSTMDVPSYHECTFLIKSEGRSGLSNSLGPHGLWTLQARMLEWVAFPFSRGCSQPRDRTSSPILQADSLPAEPKGEPKNAGVGSLSLLQGIFPTEESNQGLLYCRQTLYQLSYEESHILIKSFMFRRNLLMPHQDNISFRIHYSENTHGFVHLGDFWNEKVL